MNQLIALARCTRGAPIVGISPRTSRDAVGIAIATGGAVLVAGIDRLLPHLHAIPEAIRHRP